MTRMTRTLRLAALSVALFFLLFPLTLGKPGWPPSLKADEPAYYLMAESLARDFDLDMETEDVDRLFDEFPFGAVPNLIVMTVDGWHTVRYGKPYIYSLFAAPFTGLFGANGLLFLNMLLTVAMTWMGTRYLSRYNPPGRALLFSAGFFFLSAGFSYVFWIQPEVFNMAAVTACLFLGLHPLPDAMGRRAWIWAALSGAALAPGVYNKPMLAALGLPVLWALVSRRRWRSTAAWLGGAAVALGLIVAGSVAWTGKPTSYLGVTRQGVTLCEPGVMPIEPQPEALATGRTAVADPERPTGGAWSWIFRIPKTSVRELSEGLTYFFVGRHTGLFLYFPFTLVALVLFALTLWRRRRAGLPEALEPVSASTRWVLLGSLLLVALFFVMFIPYNWQGGGGFIGNRYFVNAVPGFLFLVTRIRPPRLVAVGWALGGILLAPLLFSPFARTGPEPTLQSHVRNAPYELFPFELSLREVPGYHRLPWGDRRMIARRDQVLPRGEAIWVRGSDDAEIYLQGEEPIRRAVFLVSSPAPGNRVVLQMGDAREEIDFAEPGGRRVVLEPGEPFRRRAQREARFDVYRLTVETETGRVDTWTRFNPPQACTNYAYNETWEESFYVGAQIIYLGDGASLDAEVFGARWARAEVPAAMTAGETVEVPVTVVNTSSATWPGGADGEPSRVKLSYRWRRDGGETVIADGRRTELPIPVPAGEAASVAVEVEAPAEPGTYRLDLDLMREHVAWFGDRGVGTSQHRVEVTPRP